MTVIELFGGPGGWAEGLGQLGGAAVSLEWDAAACATRTAAGHPTIRADVARWPLGHLPPVEGLIASPPCPMFSTAGKGAGRAITAELRAAITDALDGRHALAAHRRRMARRLQSAYATSPRFRRLPRATRSAQAWRDADEAALTVQPARWIAATRPRWIAMEQVPDVLPLWAHYARQLDRLGYRTWAGILNAADYGVPQTRRRAFLLASLDRPVQPPEPTHARDPQPTLFGTLQPWVTMAEALGWTGEDDPARTLAGNRSPRWLYPDTDGTHGRTVGFARRDDRGDSPDGYRERDWRGEDEPAHALTEKARSWVIRRVVNTGRDWKLGGTRDDAQKIGSDQPAPTLTPQSAQQWHIEDAVSPLLNPGATPSQPNRRRYGPDEPAPTVAFGNDAANWVWERPATAVCGDPRLSPPGYRGGRAHYEADPDYSVRSGDDAIRLTIEDALILQGFRPDYPVQGTRTKQFEQVGNAVPPPLAAAVLACVIPRQEGS